MSSRHALLPLLVTSSLFLVHCSGDDDGSKGNAGTSGTSTGASGGATSGSAGTGGSAGSAAGTPGAAGKAATGGSAGTGGASGSAGQGGSSGTTAGQSGNGGMPMAGRGSGGMPGGAGTGAGAAGKGGSGMSGAGGSAGAGTGGMGGGGMGGAAGKAGGGGSGGAGAMTLTSSVITEGGMFPDQSTCATTANDSPDLTWTAGPSGTMSYAMILLDTSNSLNHWVLWDIPSSITTLPAALDDMAMSTDVVGAKQKAIQGNGYYGPCPSGADHVYKFTIYALPVATLTGAMTSQQTSALAMAVMNANPLASASLSAHSSATMGGN